MQVELDKPASAKVMNFEPGGRRFYAMVSPEGQERWIIQKYTSISPKSNFKFLMLLQMKMKTWNYRVLNGIILSAKKMERQK